ncbi:hypothetical protein BCR34DRAFT_284804 [Clohesyomyces aquaticus]|uniref:Uncharacterized protein n=1 Tax=Clohesyomyces aquaticus TaxID=1231657 RepID=A0A1Y1ZRC5_9PLEO|nr:hypothetical protein BCR34DRAFT_284804 [Clohesyomyces aquaticus]
MMPGLRGHLASGRRGPSCTLGNSFLPLPSAFAPHRPPSSHSVARGPRGARDSREITQTPGPVQPFSEPEAQARRVETQKRRPGMRREASEHSTKQSAREDAPPALAACGKKPLRRMEKGCSVSRTPGPLLICESRVGAAARQATPWPMNDIAGPALCQLLLHPHRRN